MKIFVMGTLAFACTITLIASLIYGVSQANTVHEFPTFCIWGIAVPAVILFILRRIEDYDNRKTNKCY